ncbi:MAG: TetR/AcrR family transcriptional regulator [Acidimicrobiales bacterium]
MHFLNISYPDARVPRWHDGSVSTSREWTATALAVVDEHGFEALSLSAVAERLGVGPSALYPCRWSRRAPDGGRRRVDSAHGRRRARRRHRDRYDDALRAVASAYRRFVELHPGRFTATLRVSPCPTRHRSRERGARPRLRCSCSGPEDGTAGGRRGAARSAIHGYLVLQHTVGASPSAAIEFQHLVDGLCRTLEQPG